MTAPPIKNKSKLGCRSKRRYPDEVSARAAGLFSLECSATRALYVYPCPERDCRGWHLTRSPSKNTRMVTRGNPVADLVAEDAAEDFRS